MFPIWKIIPFPANSRKNKNANPRRILFGKISRHKFSQTYHVRNTPQTFFNLGKTLGGSRQEATLWKMQELRIFKTNYTVTGDLWGDHYVSGIGKLKDGFFELEPVNDFGFSGVGLKKDS